MNSIQVEFILNDKLVSVSSVPNRTLLDVLRDDFGLTGAKDACGGEGECGACTVFMDGNLVNACMLFIGQVGGHTITTIEGISKPDQLHPLQRAFIEVGAVQCGYCIPGAILSAKALLDRNLEPTELQIRESLSGNLCRCTGYTKMVDAVLLAAEELRNG